MVTRATFGLILKLWVVIVTVSVNNNMAMDIMNNTLAETQLTLSPLWDNETRSCSLEEDLTDGSVLFQGSSDHFCSLQVVSRDGTYIQLQSLLDSKDNSHGHPLMYIERNGNLSVCKNKYLVFEEQYEVCNLIFVHTNIQVILQGRAKVLLAAIPTLDLSIQCPELNTQFKDNGEKLNQTTHCKNIKGYMKKITCGPSFKDPCNLNVHDACDVILAYRKVIYQCYNHTSSQAFITYALRTNYLILNSKNIIAIQPETFWGLRDLLAIGLHENSLRSLDVETFKNLGSLFWLALQENKLNSLPPGIFGGLKNLQYLYLYSNKLTSLPMRIYQNLTNLKTLALHNNQIINLNVEVFADLNNLKELYIHNNMLSALSGRIFQGLMNLEVLRLDSNQILQLNEGLFTGLNNLKELYLLDNMLSVLEIGIFHDLIGLKSLHLSDNKLDTLPKGIFARLIKLEILYIARNQIKTLDEGLLFGLNLLKTLHLAENMLENLPNHLFGRTKQFSKYLQFSGNITLMHLLLHDNKIKAIPSTFFYNLHHLEQLTLFRNELLLLTPGVLTALNNLKLFTIHTNKLAGLSNGVFNKMTKLEMLILTSNRLKSLGVNVFRGLENLNLLHLENNTLTHLDSDVFKHTPKLTTIDLAINLLQEIPKIRNLAHLNYLRLTNNPLQLITYSSLSSLSVNSELFVSQHEICDCYSPSDVKCSASDQRSPYLTCDRLLSDRTLAIAMWLIGINALGGNIFVLVWRIKNGQSKSVNSILLSSLATADMIMGVYMVIIASADIKFSEHFPMQSETWRSGITCRIAGFLSIISSEASVFFVTLISIDRFICIRFPYSTRKIGKRSVVILVALTWVTSCVLGIIPSILSGVNFKFYDNSHVCIGLPLALTKTFSTHYRSEKTTFEAVNGFSLTIGRDIVTTDLMGLANGLYYAVAVFLGLNCVCYLIILGCYLEIVRAVKRSSKQAGRSRDMSEQITLTAKVTAIVATDFCCWFPIIILGILVQMRVVSLPPSVYAWCVTFVLPINSAINPYLYTVSEIVSNLRKKQAKKKNQPKTPCPQDKHDTKAPKTVKHDTQLTETGNSAETKE